MIHVTNVLVELKVWISYADAMANPGDIFKYLHKNKVGLKVALFWVAWAFVAEKVGTTTSTTFS